MALWGKPTLHMIVSVLFSFFFLPRSHSSQSKHKTPIKQMKHKNTDKHCLTLSSSDTPSQTHTHTQFGKENWRWGVMDGERHCVGVAEMELMTERQAREKTSGRQERAAEMGRYREIKTRRGRDECKEENR